MTATASAAGSRQRQMVNRLFEDEFNKRMGEVTELVYCVLKWTDKEAVAVSKVIATGVLKKLEKLDLYNNQIGDAGVMALAEAAGKGTLPQLEELRLNSNQIGDAGVMALAEAAGKGTLPQLKELRLSLNGTISQQAQDALKAALPNCEVRF